MFAVLKIKQLIVDQIDISLQIQGKTSAITLSTNLYQINFYQYFFPHMGGCCCCRVLQGHSSKNKSKNSFGEHRVKMNNKLAPHPIELSDTNLQPSAKQKKISRITVETSEKQSHLPTAVIIQIDMEWINFTKTNRASIKQQIKKQCIEMKLISCQNEFKNFLINYAKFFANIISQRRFIFNQSLISIIRNRFSLNQKRLMFKMSQFDKKMQNPVTDFSQFSQFLKEIRKAVESTHIIYEGTIEITEMQAQANNYLNLLEKAISSISDEDVNSTNTSTTKERIVQILNQWATRQMTNQFLANCQYISNIIDEKKQPFFQEVNTFICQCRQSKKNIIEIPCQVIAFIGKFEQCKKDGFSSIMSQSAQNQDIFDPPMKQTDEKRFQFNKKSSNYFRRSDSTHQKKRLSGEESLQKQNSSKINEQNVKKTVKSEINPQTIIYQKSQFVDYKKPELVIKHSSEQNKLFIKTYIRPSEISTNTRYCKMQTYILYTEKKVFGPSKDKFYYQKKLQALLAENTMNIIRYLQKQENEWIMKFHIVLDEKPHTRKMIEPSPQKRQLCFHYESQKGQKQFSIIYHKKNILNTDIWKLRSRKAIYNFLHSFASIIIFLEEHRIHQTDFQFSNFIKVANRFLLIDLQHAFFCFKSPDNNKELIKLKQQCRLINQRLFRNWHHSNYSDCLAKLEIYEKRYRKFLEKNGPGVGAELCLDIMFENMVNSHYLQFYQLVNNLFSLQVTDQALIKPEERLEILALIPQIGKNQFFTYEKFKQQLNHIYYRFHKIKKTRNYDKIGMNHEKLSTRLSKLIQQPLFQRFKQKYHQTVNLFLVERPQRIIKFQSVQRYEDDLILYFVDGLQNITHQDVSTKGRYIVNFLTNLLELIQYSERKGWLLLNMSLNLFTQVGEQFKLRNLQYLFKICYNQESSQDDRYFVNESIKILLRIIIEGKTKDFFPTWFQHKLLKLFNMNLFHRYGGEDQRQIDQEKKIKQQIDEIHQKWFVEQRYPFMKPLGEDILRLILRQRRAIHYEQFINISMQILGEGEPEQLNVFKNKISQNILAKNISNYQSLQEDLRRQLITDSYTQQWKSNIAKS